VSDSSPENAPTVNDCLRMLTRRSVPNGQIQLYQVLLVAGSKGATTAELVSKMGRRDAKALTGILGALGNRINGTPGYGETSKPGIGMILRWSKADEGWRYYLKPVMREALAAHAPSWLPDTAISRWMYLVDLVRSRFPGWLGFEDPRFNRGPLDEVGYKLATVRKAKELLSAGEVGRLIDANDYDEIIDRLISIGDDNNLLYAPKLQRGDLKLLHRDDLNRPGFCHAFVDLLHGDKDTSTRLDRYLRWVSSQGLDAMNQWAFPTYFLFFLDAENEIFVKPQATKNLLKLGGWDVQFGAKPTGDDYARIREVYRELRDALADYGPRHMIDVQSFGWVAQEEAGRQRKARRKAKADGFVLDPGVEEAMQEFERTADASKLIDQANRIEQAKRGLGEIFGNATKLRSLSPETFFDFFNEVDAHGGSKGIFSLNVPFSKDPATPTYQQLQEDLSMLTGALTPLLHGAGTTAERVDAMWDIGSAVKNYVAEGLTVASALLFIQDPEKASGVLPMQKKEEKLRATGHMPEVPRTATLGERFEAFEQALNKLPERYGRNWTPEARKEFYFSKVKVNEEGEANGGNGLLPPEPSFGGLIEELRGARLHFSAEVVANYVLALQAKRFAILTGISGTGKTQIARRLAQYCRRPVAELPEDAKEIRVVTTNLKHGVIELPKDIGSNLKLPPTKEPDLATARGRIRVLYPEGDTTLSFRAPQPGRVRLHPSGSFKKWFGAHLKPEDYYWLRVLDDDDGDYDRLEIGLPATRLVEERSANYTVVPVRPDWVDNRGLRGYLNPITGAYSMTPFLSLLLKAREEEARAERDERDPHPFFVVLDEMNLARVEHYFSDFLSALESDEPIPLHDVEEIEDGSAESGVPVPRRLRVPKNVFFTGTVNVDETTYMFSPKVLDRAFTIEFDRVDLAGYTDGVAPSESSELDLSAGKDGTLRFTPYEKPDRDHWLEFTRIADGRYAQILRDLHAILEEEHRHFGYRVANEIARFVNLAREQSANGDEAAKAAFDLALLQKVLPKFHGTQQELESLLERMFNFAVHGGDRRRGDTSVSLDEWTIKDGHLTSKGRAPSPADVPEETSHRDADGSADENQGSENEADAGDGAAEGPDPEFPRTAAKIWRMLRRLRQRGFTAFIE